MFAHAARRPGRARGGGPGHLRPLRPRGLGRLRRPGRGRARRARHRRRGSAHRSPAPERAILEAAVVLVGGGNTFRLLDSLQRLGVVDGLAARVRDGRDPLHRLLGGHQRDLPDDPDDQRHADLPSPLLRRARPAAVPGQPPLRRCRPDLDLHGRDPRRAHRGVPRGQRLPRAGHVRGLVAAGAAANGRPCTARPGCSPATAWTTSRSATTSHRCCVRRRPSTTATGPDRGRTAPAGRVGTPVRLSGDLSLTHGPPGCLDPVASSEP